MKKRYLLQAHPTYEFKGYDKIILKFSELEEILSDKTLYEIWHSALASINAIYLIVDTKSGGMLAQHMVAVAY